MTNYEHYKEQIERITRLGLGFGIDNNTGAVGYCTNIICEDCKFHGGCSDKKVKWADEEYEEPTVGWSKVPIDTKVMVSDDGEHWERRYFAGVDDRRKPLVWGYGATSWSFKWETQRMMFDYTKLAKKD